MNDGEDALERIPPVCDLSGSLPRFRGVRPGQNRPHIARCIIPSSENLTLELKSSALGMARERYTSNAGSATSVFKAGGHLIALTFPIKKTGYKAEGAYGSRPVFSSESTNTFYQKQVNAAGEGKKLEPYRPNAPRNRPKYMLVNVVGTRHKLHPCILHETHRGSSQVKLSDGHVDSQRPWKTTNQVFAECTQAREAIGIENQGISSNVARFFHKKQELYGTT